MKKKDEHLITGIKHKFNDKTYSTKVVCTNCDFKGNLSFSKGDSIEYAPCPKCECDALVKDWE